MSVWPQVRYSSFTGPCGVKRVHVSWSPQIVGGVAAKPGEWPWQAQLKYSDDGGNSYHICGASILDHYWIVTAAHCVVGKNTTSFNVTVGRYSEQRDIYRIHSISLLGKRRKGPRGLPYEKGGDARRLA